ncbi:MAG: DEAD/DEAH box helicase family protein [Nocardiopsaceae bacterium]|nr:DEAD/DEAH box helicase family protein [Nocardiopsaceae bacterium]
MTPGSSGPLKDEACREFVLPALTGPGGWREDQIRQAYPINRGRIRANTLKYRQDRPEIADYVLEYSSGLPVAVIEAKRSRPDPADGIERARQHAELLDVPFAYSTDGDRVIELDSHAGRTTEVTRFPAPRELWQRYAKARDLAGEAREIASAPLSQAPRNWDETPMRPRYYQETAINRAVQAIARGENRILLVLAAGAGKTLVAAQIAAKLRNSGWPRGRKPRVLYLADRALLLEQARDGYFRPVFGEEVAEIGEGDRRAGRDVYLGLCGPADAAGDALAAYRRFRPDFFDLIIVDECHGGIAATGAAWHAVLERFGSAVHVGLTATPLSPKDASVYRHFGEPLHTYSLARGIADGFLAPFRIRRVRLDLNGDQHETREKTIVSPDALENHYMSWQLPRLLGTLDRTEEAARYLADYMSRTGRLNKTLVFCQDPEHASRMTGALSGTDLARKHGPGYACQITSADADAELLEKFRRPGPDAPVIAVTSDLLTAGIDIPALRNVVLYRVIGSMPEFKQVIGRAARLFPGDGKLSFDIIDFTAATSHFQDPRFDGYPARLWRDETDRDGRIVDTISDPPPQAPYVAEPPFLYREVPGGTLPPAASAERAGQRVPADEEHARAVRARVLSLELAPHELLDRWAHADTRRALRERLAEWRVDADGLADWAGCRGTDVIDLLCFVTWQLPPLTRAERAQRVRQRDGDFFASYPSPLEQALRGICDSYAARGPDALDDAVSADTGYPGGLVELAVSHDEFRAAVDKLGTLIYAGS